MTTDPAVTAAAEALRLGVLSMPTIWRTPEAHANAVAPIAVAAARPIIEAELRSRPDYYDAAYVEALLARRTREVRERISEEVRAMGHGDYFHGPAWEQVDAAEHCGRCSCAEEFADRVALGES